MMHVPPHNFEAEQALLGALMLNNRAYDKVSEFLHPEHFAEPGHGNIYKAIAKLISSGRAANPVTLKTHLEQDLALSEIGGTEYLAQLAGATVSIVNAGDYGRLIFDLHLRRELMALGAEVAEEAATAGSEASAQDIAHGFEARVFALTEAADGGEGARSFRGVMVSMTRQSEVARINGGGLIGLATGLEDLDNLLGGLAPGNLIVLGARPAMGKSALMCSVARCVAQDQAPVGVFSLEMKAEEIAQRMAADTTGIQYVSIRNGRLNDDEWHQVKDAERELSSLPLHIDDAPGLHIDQIRVRARRMVRRYGVGLIVVDHLHLIRGAGKDRLAELTRISASLKEMARELNIPVLALCQLSRAVEQRDDKRPQMSDLRESGSLEQDADVVSFLYRKSYYLENAEPQKGEREKSDAFTAKLADWHSDCARERNRAQMFVQKNRHGQTGVASLYCDLALSRFRSLATTSEGGM